MSKESIAGSRRVDQIRAGDRAVVIGAGPAGLTSAYLLTGDGVPVTVLEADGIVGGLARTVEHNGYRFDIGGHRFFTKYEVVENLWREILGPELISVPRKSRLFYDGKFFDYPLKPLNALRGLGVPAAVLILLSFLKAQILPYRVEENFEQWVTNRFGKRLYEIFFKTYTEKVWGIPCTEIRAEWAAQRIQGLSLVRAILSAASLNKRSTAIKTLIHEFTYPRLGPGQMWQTCRERVEERGGKVLLHHAVDALEVRDGRVVAVRAATPVGGRRIEGEHFVVTMPLRSLVRSLEPSAPEEVVASAEGLNYRDFVVVVLIVDEADIFSDNWIYIHSPGVKVGRIQNFKNWSRDMVPDPTKTCLGMEYFCFEGDGLWSSPDDELIALAKSELDELRLADTKRVIDGTVVRMPKAYPVYDSSYRDCLAVVRRYLDSISNLHPVGRNGLHKYNNQDHSMLTAMMAVWNMRGADYDIWAVNTDFEYNEEIQMNGVEKVPCTRPS